MATTTTKFSLTNSGWTDLGAGPLLLGFTGAGVFAIGDVTPVIPISEGFTVVRGEAFRVETSSHVWAMASGASGVTAYVSAY
jgi:hypothetical protein